MHTVVSSLAAKAAHDSHEVSRLSARSMPVARSKESMAQLKRSASRHRTRKVTLGLGLGQSSVDLLPSITNLLEAHEERIVAKLQEISSQLEQQSVSKAMSFRTYQAGNSIDSVIKEGTTPQDGSTRDTAELALQRENRPTKLSLLIPSAGIQSEEKYIGTEQGNSDGPKLKKPPSYAELWWSKSQARGQDCLVTRAASMLSSFVESKGWVKRAPPVSETAKKKLHNQKSVLQRFILSPLFDTICALMILANSILLGYQIEYMAVTASGSPMERSTGVQAVFTSWFAVELLMRAWAEGADFVFSKDWRWNAFDTVIVIISSVELVLHIGKYTESSNFAVVRVLRVLRLVRVVRIIRVVRFFSQLRLMVNSTMNSFKPFFWALCLLFLLVYIVGVQLTQSVLEYLSTEGRHDAQMVDYFGTLHQSVYTLFQVVSGGLNWREPASALLRIHWVYAPIMSVFVSFTVFAVLNIVTGVFVGSAMQSAQADQDVVIQDAMNEEDSFANEVLRIFEEADKDHSGFITCQELEGHLRDQRVRAYLHHLELEVQEARGLFNLLDICNTGRVSSHEFLLGCMRLKGPAKNVDVATILYENKRMMDTWQGFFSFIEQQFECLFEILAGEPGDGMLASEKDPLYEEDGTDAAPPGNIETMSL